MSNLSKEAINNILFLLANKSVPRIVENSNNAKLVKVQK
jgi:hypothetical protein